MLLGLLCEHVRLGHAFPQTTYEVFSKYIEYRFAKDSHRVVERHGIDTSQVRDIAEKIAFTMTADLALGLNPKRVDVLPALHRQGFRIAKSRLVSVFNALEYMKIGRADSAVLDEEDRDFTFAHRRFQEYFATAIVIADPHRIPPLRLLFDARWRETAVVLCQTGDPSHVEPIISEASSFLAEGLAGLSYTAPAGGEPFPWPAGMLHLLSIVQSGFSSFSDQSIVLLRDQAGKILELAYARGDFLDKKYALEFSGVAPQPTLARLVNKAYSLDSPWLADIMFRQVGKLSSLTPAVLGWIRKYLLTMSFSGQLKREATSIRAYIARLPNSTEMQRVASFAFWLPTLDVLCWLVAFIGLGIMFHGSAWRYSIMSGALVVYIIHRWSLPWVASKEEIPFHLACVPLIFLFPSLSLVAESSKTQVILGALVSYCLSWPYSSIICVSSGEVSHLFLWPITPFLLLFRIINEMIRAPLGFVKLGFKKVARAIVGMIVTGAMMALIVTGFAFGVAMFQRFMFVRSILYIMVALLCLIMIYVVAKWCMDHLRDYVDLRKWRSGATAATTAEALVVRYDNLRTRNNKLETSNNRVSLRKEPGIGCVVTGLVRAIGVPGRGRLC